MKKKILSIAIAIICMINIFACNNSKSIENSNTENSKEAVKIVKTPYSEGPMTIEEIVNKMVSGCELEELSEEDRNYVVNLGSYNCDHMTAGPIADYIGLYKALGINCKLTMGANVPEAMQAGKMDIAYCGWTTTLSAVKNGIPLFIAAENHTGGAEYLVVKNDIDMSDPQNLINKSISIGTDPETTNLNWAEWSDQLGIPRDATQYTSLSMKDSDEYLAMAAGKLDAYICCDPWGTMAEYSGVGKIVIRQDTDRTNVGLGHGTCCKVAMNYNFAKEHPKLASRMLLAHTLALEFCYEHPYLASYGFSAYYNVPVKVALENFWRKFVNEGRTLRWDLNKEYMRNQLKAMEYYNVRDDINKVEIDDYVDLSYFNNANADDFEEFIKKNIDPVFPEGMDWESYYKKALEIDGINEKDIPEYVTLDRK